MKAKPNRCYEAEVKVKNKETLRPDSNLNDGDIIKVQYGWLMDEDDPFPGQVAFMQPANRNNGYWIPEENLILKKEISFKEFNQ